MADDAGRTANAVEVKMLSGAVSVATGVTHFDKGVEHGAHAAIVFPLHGASRCVAFTAHAIGGGFTFTGRVIGGSFAFVGHVVGSTFGFFSGLTHVSSVIRPTDHTPAPTITQIRAQQATIIQSGTKSVSVLSMSLGAGGACDNGQGNGHYPMNWCNAPMDSLRTVPYSSDPINRECTSYAYWYFTSVEGHTDFRARGDAKYWAVTSNYPTHAAPAVGAIAIETAGAYGHVAIVQALSGQKYAGHAVPAGYVLVSAK